MRVSLGSVALLSAAVLLAGCGSSDPASGPLSTVRSIPTQEAPRITPTPDGGLIYVASGIECSDKQAGRAVEGDVRNLTDPSAKCSEVQVVDAQSYETLKTLRPELGVTEVVFGARAPVALLLGTYQQRATVLDANTLEPTVTMATNGYPTDAVLSPDGATAYVSTVDKLFGRGQSAGALEFFDTASGDLLRAGPGLAGASASASVGPGSAGTYLSVTKKRGRGAVLALGPDGRKVVARLPLGGRPGPVSFGPDGSRAYVPDSSGVVTVIDTGTKRAVGRVTTGRYPVAVSASPDGRQLWVTSFHEEPRGGNPESSMTVFDAQALKPLGVVATGHLSGGLWFVHEGGVAYLGDSGADGVQSSATESTIRVIDRNTLRETAVIPIGQSPMRPSFSPDRALMFVSDLAPSGAVRVVDTDSNQVVQTIPFNSPGPAVAAGGRSVFVPLQSDYRVEVLSSG